MATYAECTTAARDLANTNLVGAGRPDSHAAHKRCACVQEATSRKAPQPAGGHGTHRYKLTQCSTKGIRAAHPRRSRAQTERLPIPVPGAGAVSGVAGVVRWEPAPRAARELRACMACAMASRLSAAAAAWSQGACDASCLPQSGGTLTVAVRHKARARQLIPAMPIIWYQHPRCRCAGALLAGCSAKHKQSCSDVHGHTGMTDRTDLLTVIVLCVVRCTMSSIEPLQYLDVVRLLHVPGLPACQAVRADSPMRALGKSAATSAGNPHDCGSGPQ